MKKIDKKKITSAIYNRLNKEIPKKSIYDAIMIISDLMIESLIENKSISISNFGTLSPFLFHAHRGLNIAAGSIESVKPFRMVKFRAHHNFNLLIEQRKDKFKAS